MDLRTECSPGIGTVRIEPFHRPVVVQLFGLRIPLYS
jgi:hypothetical protein